MKTFLALAVTAAAAVAAAAPAGAKSTVQITIRHQTRGCHAWAIGTGAYTPSQSIVVAGGTTIAFTNNDVMPQSLKQLAGPRVGMRNIPSSTPMAMGLKGPFAPGVMAKMGAGTSVTLTQPGVYRFTTKGGEDYMEGMKTVGPDNVLKLVVVVK